jgi:iron-sulfur cluster repair protein YtfE (RIC family)
MDLIDHLLHDHQQLQGLLETYHEDPLGKFHALRECLGHHAHEEESVLYPVTREFLSKETSHAVQEHTESNKLLAQLEYDPHKEEVFEEFKKSLQHHIEEEENNFFPKVREELDSKQLVAMYEEAKELFGS